MATQKPLEAREVARRCDGARLGFYTTASLADLEEPLGQERALEALRFAVGIEGLDYNVFAYGAPGLGRHLIVQRVLQEHAAKAPTPADWCYVHDFDAPNRPRWLSVPAGRGRELREGVKALIEGLKSAIPASLEADEFRLRKTALEEEIKREHQAEVEEVHAEAARRGLAVIHTQEGFTLVPTREGKLVTPEEFDKLPEEDREHHRRAMREIGEVLDRIVARIPKRERERTAKLRALIAEVTKRVIEEAVHELRSRWQDVPAVIEHLARVEKDLMATPDEIAAAKVGSEEQRTEANRALARFNVNLLVERTSGSGAPVVYEDHPTYERLLGRVEHHSVQGTLITDLTLIKAGALHQANGGFLIVDASRVLSEPLAWDALKRALRARSVAMDSFGRALGFSSTQSLDPTPIPLSLRVVMVGSRLLYELLCAHDSEFLELFKIPAEFAEEVTWNAETQEAYARLIATMVREEKLLHLHSGAVARIIEEAARRAADSQKLAVRLRELSELLRESSHIAHASGLEMVRAEEVERALETKIHRADRAREQTYELIRRGTLLIDVAGERVGQVNGLMVIELGGFRFGCPGRITARTSLGHGQLIDIEREVKLGGPLHSKGVLILQGFLTGRFVTDVPLSLSGSLVFEQSYGRVEGDSASSGELAALLSSIGEIPVTQALAVTGSVNQLGELQPIGGANEKIEGYFDACRAAGATNEQGVIIPVSNVPNLMLRADVVSAIERGEFRVFAARTIDEVMELLTALPAGERGPDGHYPPSTVNGRVEARLRSLAVVARRFARPGKSKEEAR